MFIYDSTTLAFIRKTENMAREILVKAGLTVKRSRFHWKNMLYPIQVVVFEGAEWGHFNTSYLQVALNRRLIYMAKDSVVRDILKHELAHYFTYIQYGEVDAHGKEFKQVCFELGFPAEISAATMKLDLANESKEGDLASEKVLEKVKKLFQLSQSPNVHEAELATMKANELLLRHNLDRPAKNEDPIYLERVLMRQKKDAKISSIYEILKHFIVRTVISYGKGSCCLEVSGSLTNVRLAKYVAEFLDRELDQLWLASKQEHGLSGLRSKNSFFHGVAKGFEEKMKKTKSGLSNQDQRALVLVERKLKEATDIIYRRLSSSSSSARIDQAAKDLGFQKGKTLTIRNAVESTSKKLQISFHRTNK